VAVGLTVNTIGAGTNVLAYLTITGGPINYVFIGTPTATVGHEFDSPTTGNAGSTSGTWICGTQLLLGFRAIRQSTTDAKLHVTYFRQ
jgi:hypothetical protein